jgi:hypothetical protein
VGTDLILACKSKGRKPDRRAPVISAGDLNPASAAGESAAARISCPPLEILEGYRVSPARPARRPVAPVLGKKPTRNSGCSARPTLTPATPARRPPSPASNTAEVAAARWPSRSAAVCAFLQARADYAARLGPLHLCEPCRVRAAGEPVTGITDSAQVSHSGAPGNSSSTLIGVYRLGHQRSAARRWLRPERAAGG